MNDKDNTLLELADLTCVNTNGSIEFNFGAPTHKHSLRYSSRNKNVLFLDACIYYYSNGLYKFMSPGESYYGAYVLNNDFKEQSYTIRYISLPSKEWGNNTVFHQITYINELTQKTFIQRDLSRGYTGANQLSGNFIDEINTECHPKDIYWVCC